MPEIKRDRVQELLADANSGDRALKGRALEQLVVHLFDSIPGVACVGTNVLDEPGAHEIDVFFRNEQERSGLPHLPHLLTVECKNWGSAVGSAEVSRFGHKIGARGESFGILATKNGIAGAGHEGPLAAYTDLIIELARGRAIIIFEERELAGVKSGKRLAELVMKKWMELKTRRGLYWATDEELAKREYRMGIREAIREFRRTTVEEFLAVMTPAPDMGRAISEARDASRRLEEAVAFAHTDSSDPFWHNPRAMLVEFGAAASSLVFLSEHAHEGNAEWLEIAADVNGPDRIHAFVGGELWRTLIAYYLDQVETSGELDSYLASLALVQLAIDQVAQIESIEPEYDDD